MAPQVYARNRYVSDQHFLVGRGRDDWQNPCTLDVFKNKLFIVVIRKPDTTNSTSNYSMLNKYKFPPATDGYCDKLLFNIALQGEVPLQQ